MPNQTRIVAPGPHDRTVRAVAGQSLRAPADWELLPPGDAALARRVKAAGPTWTIQQKQGRKVFSLGKYPKLIERVGKSPPQYADEE